MESLMDSTVLSYMCLGMFGSGELINQKYDGKLIINKESRQ